LLLDLVPSMHYDVSLQKFTKVHVSQAVVVPGRLKLSFLGNQTRATADLAPLLGISMEGWLY